MVLTRKPEVEGVRHGSSDDLDRRHIDPRVGALTLERAAHAPRQADEVWMAVHMDDVVEIAGPATLGERSKFFAAQFRDGVQD
jgi:hypothetical protein